MLPITDISINQIVEIERLWESNRQFHEAVSQHFSEIYRHASFDARMQGFASFAPENLKISVAMDGSVCRGYCISTIADDAGEISSLHVEKTCRGTGLGKALMLEHIAWLKERNCSAITVTVAHENQNTLDFYQSLGFYPNTVTLQLK